MIWMQSSTKYLEAFVRKADKNLNAEDSREPEIGGLWNSWQDEWSGQSQWASFA